MDEPCDICGDIGVVDVIATCSQCKITREHVYCMMKNREDFPLNWLCGECESTSIVSSNSSVKEDLPRTVVSNFSNMMHHVSKVSAGYTKLSGGARGNWREKEVGTGKTKYLWTQEVIKMPLVNNKSELNSRICRLASSPSKSITSTMGMVQMKPKSVTRVNSSCKVKGNPCFGPFRSSGHLNPPRPGNTQSNPMVQKLNEKNAILPTTKEHAQKRRTKPAEEIEPTNTMVQKEMGKSSCLSLLSSHCQPHIISEKSAILSPAKEDAQGGQTINALTSAVDIETTDVKMQKAIGKASCASLLSIYCQPPVISGGNFTKNVEPKNFDAKNRTAMNVVPTIEEYFSDSTIEEKLLTDPAPNASWKGSFKLKDEEASDGFWAHHPAKVRRKVYEFSKKMPEVIEFELLPCQDFLMDIFQGDCPDKDDIGLYFFPRNSERSKNYISLMEHLSEEELVMRSFIDGVELLVFTSKVLHEDSCKWNKYDFLWGLYHCLKLDITRCTLDINDTREDNNMVVDMDIDIHDADSNAIVEVIEEVDMEIDMVGGKTVGTLDIVISKESVESGYGISGAEATAIVLPNAAVLGNMHPSLVIKKEMCNDIPPGFGVSSREMCNDNPLGFGVSSREMFIEIPPGISISSGQMCRNIPPGIAVPIKIEKRAL